MKKLVATTIAALVLSSTTLGEPGSTTPQAARRSQRSATVTISAPTDGSVFYGAYNQKLSGSALYGDGSAVPAERLRWSDTIGGKTTGHLYRERVHRYVHSRAAQADTRGAGLFGRGDGEQERHGDLLRQHPLSHSNISLRDGHQGNNFRSRKEVHHEKTSRVGNGNADDV
jgi:hypothetical protein